MRKRKKLRKTRIFLGILTGVLLVLTVSLTGLGILIQTKFEMHLPEDFFRLSAKGESPHFFVYRFSDRENRLGEALEVTSKDFAQEQSAYIFYPEIPKDLIHAFVAIEDKRFFEHDGVDWYRTVAAGINYVLGYSDHFGASTITQQLIKNMSGKDEVTLSRKMQEILYALDMERRLDKSEILELYLNVIHFSDHCDGIAQASMHYFSKEPQELTLAECATIAAITNSPSYYNPIRHPKHNLERRNTILFEMYQQGYISQDAYHNAVAQELDLNVQDRNNSGGEVNSWYVDRVIEDVIGDLVKEYGVSRSTASQWLYSGGLRIEMAMDPEIQSVVEDYYRAAVVMPKNENGVSAQSALIVIDPHTGDVLGVAGAVGEKQGNRVQNFATQTLRPPGSTIKPISVYAPALEEGIINWASVYDDVPTDFGVSGHVPWPKNATGVYRGLTNVAYAVAHSTNTVAVRILEELGLERSFSYAKEKFHLSSMVQNSTVNDCDVAALALGQLNYGVTLRELTNAYTVFADEGIYHPWRSYYRVLDSDGRILLSCPDRGEVVLSAANAAIMTKLLQGVISDGTSSAITLGKLVECAGKTGTTNRDGDRWFIGYTPDLICGVWCGYEYPEPLTGRNLCTTIWNRIMHSLVEIKKEKENFYVPSNLVRASYCRDSGMLISDACRLDARGDRAQIGWFVAGDEPHVACDCHVLCHYDTEHGGIDHGYCPIEEQGSVALIRVKRKFPIQIYVTDSQYVYGGDPSEILPNENSGRAYFDQMIGGYHGISNVSVPFNRSCTVHLHPPESDDWEYLLPKQWVDFEE